MMFVPSSDCWLEALQGIQQQHGRSTHDYSSQDHNNNNNNHHQDGMAADACGWMNMHHQKLLALELAWCHISDLGRRLFRQDDDNNHEGQGHHGHYSARHHYHHHHHQQQHSSSRTEDHQTVSCSNDYANHLVYCLTRLTPSAETAYTHFLTYIHQLCIRLSKEVVMNQFYQTTVKLSQAATMAEEQMRRLVQQQQEIGSSWKNQHDETILLQQEWQRTIQQDRVQWEDESRILRRQWKEQQEQWRRELEAYQQAQIHERAEQQRILNRQHEEMLGQFSDTITTWAQQQTLVSPWSLIDRLHSWYQSARMVSQMVGIVFHVVATLLVIRALTYPRCLQWLWRCLVAWILLGGLMEILALVFQWSDKNDNTTTLRGGDNASISEEGLSHSIRGMIWSFGALFYMLGIILSPCCYWRRLGQDDQDDVDADNDNVDIHRGPHTPPALLVGPTRRKAELENMVQPETDPFAPLHLAEISWRLQHMSYPPFTGHYGAPPAFGAQNFVQASRTTVASQPQCHTFQVAPSQHFSPINQVTTTPSQEEHDSTENPGRSDCTRASSEFEDARGSSSDSISMDSSTMTYDLPIISNDLSMMPVRSLCLDEEQSIDLDEEYARLHRPKRHLFAEESTTVNDESSFRNDDHDSDDVVSRSRRHHRAKRARRCEDERRTCESHDGHQCAMMDSSQTPS
jgi:hypothetical protein